VSTIEFEIHERAQQAHASSAQQGISHVNNHNPFHFSQTPRRPTSVIENRAPQMPAPMRVVTSQSLFVGEHEIGIEHHGALYRLKITRQGKLILNK
jgi:hemin uptake protein HemP